MTPTQPAATPTERALTAEDVRQITLRHVPTKAKWPECASCEQDWPCDASRLADAERAARGAEQHVHRIEYPSSCTGCEHLAASFVATAPDWMRVGAARAEPGRDVWEHYDADGYCHVGVRPDGPHIANLGRDSWPDVHGRAESIAAAHNARAARAEPGRDLDAIADDVRYAGGNGTSDYWRGFNDGIDKLRAALEAHGEPSRNRPPKPPPPGKDREMA
jgi:hypothetical protein